MKIPTHKKIKGLEGITVGDFWSWAYSDIMGNLNRSVFAEFVVGSALGLDDKCRLEWDAYDLEYRGKKIEVKCAAYIQSWQQHNPSIIRFDIAKKKSWFAESNTFLDIPTRSSDCYIFCVYPETDPQKADILDVTSWLFFVVATEEIDRRFGNQKTIGIKKIQAICDPVKYNDLKKTADLTISNLS